MDLSIIIVTFNNSKLLRECLNSIYKNTHKISFEVFVIDNASSDDSSKMVRVNFPNVKLIENRENLGFAKANNQGLERASGRYSVLLNDDTVVYEEAFDRMVEFMDTKETAGACGPKLINLDGSIQRQGGLFQRRFWLSKKEAEVSFLTGACLMVKGEVIETVGMLDENFFFYNEDLDWCKRIKKAGYKIYYLPQAVVLHYGGGRRMVQDKRLTAEGIRGGLYFCKKHYGSLIYNLYRIFLFFGIIIILVGNLLLYPFKPKEISNKIEIIKLILRGKI